VDLLRLELRTAKRTEDQPIAIEYYAAARTLTTHLCQGADLDVVDDSAIPDFNAPQ
jgi:hypothetical protein